MKEKGVKKRHEETLPQEEKEKLLDKSKPANAVDKKKTKKNTSLRLEKQTLKALKILALEQETSIQNLIEKLIKDYLKKHQK